MTKITLYGVGVPVVSFETSNLDWFKEKWFKGHRITTEAPDSIIGFDLSKFSYFTSLKGEKE